MIFAIAVSIATEAVSFKRTPVLPSVGGVCVYTKGALYVKLHGIIY